MKRTILLCISLFTFFAAPGEALVAQEREARVTERHPAEKETLVSALRTVVALVQDITRRHAAAPVSDQLHSLSGRLSKTAIGFSGFRGPTGPVYDDDLAEALLEIRRDLRRIARQLNRSDRDLADRLNDVIDDLDGAIDVARTLERQAESEWLESGRYGKYSGTQARGRTWAGDEEEEDDPSWRGDRNEEEEDDPRRRSDRVDEDDNDDWWDINRWNWDVHWPRDGRWHSRTTAFVGEFNRSWPFQEHAIYRPIPAFRYNRVEGFVLGIRRLPIEWSSRDRGRIYGQVGYAFSLDDVRYEIGAETRRGRAYRNRDFDIKIGGAYRKNTATRDLWKASWVENTLAAGLFRHDFFDYYEIEGWTAYVVGRLTPYVQFSAGFREDEYRSLTKESSWSLFGGDPFRLNPAIDEGTMRSVVVSLEGGRVRGLGYHPEGMAFRLQAEFGKGMGGDFSFSRYMGDVRSYVRFGRDAGFSLRLRGSYADGDVPLQKAFTLGGVGSVRAYPQNVFYGTRMLLANAEYALYNAGFIDGLFDEMTLFGLFDAGWTNSAGTDSFDFDDVIPAAGFGIALDDRHVRLEMTWPLRDMGTGNEPTLWLRLNPTF